MTERARVREVPAAPSARALLTTRVGLLAVALLAVEAIAGMQAAVTATVTPLMAADLGAHRYYGIIEGLPLAATFITMAWGAALLGRVSAGRLLGLFTGVTIIAAAVAATAQAVAVFTAGRVLAGLAAGALATVSMSALVTAMPQRWRQMVLAGFSAMWVVTSILGPVYASWISAQFSWRWALVAYLPVLVAARLLVARQLPRTPIGQPEETFSLSGGFALAGIVVLTAGAVALPAPWSVALAFVCALLGVMAASRLLPAGTARLQRGRPAAVATLGVVTGAYFGASAVVTILAHDLLGFSVPQLGFLLLAGGLGWAVTGVFVGRSPAAGARYISRARWGATLLTMGLVTMWIAVAADWVSPAWYIAAWAVAGVGMGLVYLDTINVIVEEPPVPDGISPVAAGTSTVVVEQASAALIGTTVATVVGALLSSTANSAAVASALLLLALITAGLWLTTARTKPS